MFWGDLMVFEEILYIGILLVGAKLMGEVFRRIHQPVLIGHVIAGIVLGPALFAIIQPIDEIELFLSIGIFFLFFLMGIEINIKYISKMLRPRLIIAAVVAFLIPFFIATQFIQALDFDFTKSVIIGSVIGVTSMGVVAKVLIDLGKIRTTLGLQIFTVGIMVELLGVIITSMLVQIERSGPDATIILWMIYKIVVFFAIACPLSYFILPKFLQMIKTRIKLKYVDFVVIIALILSFAYAAEISGIHGAIGALIFGVAFTRIKKQEYTKTISHVNRLGHGYLIPLFFAGIGIYFNTEFLHLSTLAIIGFLLFIPIIKFVSGFIAARITDIRPIRPLTFGIMAKGGLDLALLRILLEAEIIDQALFSILILASLITLTIAGIGLYRSILRAPTSEIL